MGGFNAVSIFSWVAMGITFAIPSVTNGIQDMLKAKPLISAGPEGVVGAISQPTMMAWQVGQFFMTHQQMQGIAKAVNANKTGGGGGDHPPAPAS